MDKNRKVRSIGCLVLLIFFLMPVLALGADTNDIIDIDRDVHLTIHYEDNNQPLADAVFQVYLAATLDEQGNRMVTDAFQQYPVNWQSNDSKVWKTMADTLEGLIAVDQHLKTAASGQTDQNGNLEFGTKENLKPGLYLVTGERHGQDGRIYYAKPFLVQLPVKDSSESWEYTITANTKFESIPAPGGDRNGGKLSWTSRKVLKVWEDKDNEDVRPKNVVIQLLRDGSIYDTVTLTEAGNWRYEWPALSTNYRWTVVEKDSGDYDVRVSQEGITFVVTNTYKKENPDEEIPSVEEEISENPTPTGSGEPPYEKVTVTVGAFDAKLPQTGQLWWPVAVLIASGMVFIIAGLILRRGEQYGPE